MILFTKNSFLMAEKKAKGGKKNRKHGRYGRKAANSNRSKQTERNRVRKLVKVLKKNPNCENTREKLKDLAPQHLKEYPRQEAAVDSN